jgi:hypothetical protein
MTRIPADSISNQELVWPFLFLLLSLPATPNPDQFEAHITPVSHALAPELDIKLILVPNVAPTAINL